MEWTESVPVDRPVDEVLAAVSDQHELMRWSAWPEATGYTCAVETGDGRTVGSEIVFRGRSGTEQGRQRLDAVRREGDGHLVAYRLTNRGPGGRQMRPEVDYRIAPADDRHTRVDLVFRATPPLPRPLRGLVERLMAPRVRALHVEDLRLLKAHVEARGRSVDPAA